ncbi:hypothetical protein PG991_003388 [Apiospora marii]|uniref:Rhodopsin domain-containing protein n=1 Tax=Apiospora marii TaxID=335849 RepID=A0ABR1S3C0_9PEZI
MSTAKFDFYTLDPATQAFILQNKPALDPPAGQQPNFDNPPNGSAGVAVLFAICLTLVTVGLAARVYTRFFCTKQKAIVDYLLILAYAIILTSLCFMVRDINNPGLFIHQYDVRLGDFIAFLKDIFIVEQLNTVTLCLIKVAILLDWIRIFAPTRTGFVYWASHVTIWASIGFYAARLVTFNVACVPYALVWDKMLQGNCDRVNVYYMSIATCIFHIVSDMQVLPPFPFYYTRAIWSLHMTTQKKTSVSVVFAIGLLACISTVIRSVELVTIFFSTDVMHGYSVGICLGASELTCGFLTITVPSIPQALSSIRSSKLASGLSIRFSRIRQAWSHAENNTKSSNDGSLSELSSPHAGSYYEMRNMENGTASTDVLKRQSDPYERALSETSLGGSFDVERGRA